MSLKRLLVLTLPIYFSIIILLSPHTAHAMTTRAYVTNALNNTVSVIDPSIPSVIDTIPVGVQPTSITSYGNRIYVANTNDSSISVIDANTNNVIDTISVTGYPFSLAVNSDGTRLYETDFGSNTNTVSVIDTSTNSVIRELTGFCIPEAIAVTPDDAYIYVVSSNYHPACGGADGLPGYVKVIDTSNWNTVATIYIPEYPNNIAFTPNGDKAYVTSGSISTPAQTSIIDTSTNTVVNSITTGVHGMDVEISSDGTKAYVLNSFFATGNNGTVSVIDTAIDEVVATVQVGNTPTNMAISPDGSKIYVANTNGDSVSIIGTVSNSVVDTLNSISVPSHVAFATFESNMVPELESVTVSSNPVVLSGSVTAYSSFADSDSGQTWTATWNWDDGSTPDQVSVNPGAINMTHTYSNPGVYRITLTVEDSLGSSSTQYFEYVSVYDPQPHAHFGAARRFTSPLGAYTADLSLTGLAQFGVSARYSGTNAVGNISLNIPVANLNFVSTNVTSLVVASNKATLRGNGTYNGFSGYTFMVTGVDGSGGNGMIRFQIKDSGGNVVYDTQPGASDVAIPTTAVTGTVNVL